MLRCELYRFLDLPQTVLSVPFTASAPRSGAFGPHLYSGSMLCFWWPECHNVSSFFRLAVACLRMKDFLIFEKKRLDLWIRLCYTCFRKGRFMPIFGFSAEHDLDKNYCINIVCAGYSEAGERSV
jgi:hypothetical protein